MMTINEIEKLISDLPANQMAEFRSWFERFDAGKWDTQIEADAKAEKLDAMASKAIDDFEKGNCDEL